MECTCDNQRLGSIVGCILHDPGRAAERDQQESDIALLHRVRTNMKRWSSRYAGSDHAKQHVIETALLIQEIDELILRQ